MKDLNKTGDDLRSLISSCKTIAVVGMSQYAFKAAHSVPMFFKSEGFEIIPVNPNAYEIRGMKCYSSLLDVERRIDIVNVFRPSRDAEFVLRDVVRRHYELGDAGVLWLQEGIFTDDGKEICKEAGIIYIENKCMYKEYFERKKNEN